MSKRQRARQIPQVMMSGWERKRENGHFSFLIFNARSSWGPGFTSSSTLPSLPLLRPPRQSQTGGGVFPSCFGVRWMSIPPLSFHRVAKSSSTTTSPIQLQFPAPSANTSPLHMSFLQGHLEDAIPRSQHVTAHRREIPAKEATDGFYTSPPSIRQ